MKLGYYCSAFLDFYFDIYSKNNQKQINALLSETQTSKQ